MRKQIFWLCAAAVCVPRMAWCDCLGDTRPGGPCYVGPGAPQIAAPSGPVFIMPKLDDNDATVTDPDAGWPCAQLPQGGNSSMNAPAGGDQTSGDKPGACN